MVSASSAKGETERREERERERAPFGRVGGVRQVYGAVGVRVAGLEHHTDAADVIRLGTTQARTLLIKSRGQSRLEAGEDRTLVLDMRQRLSCSCVSGLVKKPSGFTPF